MGEGRVDAVAGAVGEDMRRLMLPTRERFASTSSAPGLSGRFVEGETRPIPGCFDIP